MKPDNDDPSIIEPIELPSDAAQVSAADGMLRLPSFKELLQAVPQTGHVSAT